MDAQWQAPVRAVSIESQEARWAYYAGLIAIGVICRLRPRWAPLLALAEGSGNLLMLILTILLPIWNASADLAMEGPVIGPWTLANFVLVGPMTVYAIKQAERQLWVQS